MTPARGGGWDTGKVPLEICPDPSAHNSATPQPEAGLDAAWAAAEAALPEGYGLGITKTVNVYSGAYVATTDFGSAQRGYAYGPTPAAALLALAAALREPKP